jgi:UDP-N-acetyl-D-glucosamine dehydrogenase
MPLERKPEFFKGAQLKVGVIGCGYVGLPLSLRFAEAGHRVIGFDTDVNKIAKATSGTFRATEFSCTSVPSISPPAMISHGLRKWTPW